MTYKEALEKIATVNAMDYEYQAWAREALDNQEQRSVSEHTGEPIGEVILWRGEKIVQWGQSLPVGTKFYTTPQPKQEQGEPVAWISWNRVSGESKLNYHKVSSKHDATLWSHFPLYTTPQQRKPLTDEQIKKVWGIHDDDDDPTNIVYERDITRAIEDAHGIKE